MIDPLRLAPSFWTRSVVDSPNLNLSQWAAYILALSNTESCSRCVYESSLKCGIDLIQFFLLRQPWLLGGWFLMCVTDALLFTSERVTYRTLQTGSLLSLSTVGIDYLESHSVWLRSQDVLMVRLLALYQNGELAPNLSQELFELCFREEAGHSTQDSPHSRSIRKACLHCVWYFDRER